MEPRDEFRRAVYPTDGATNPPRIILVVDEDAATLERFEGWLRGAGFWVARASDALEAFEYALDVRPDAVIAALDLPGPMNGADLIREIQADTALQRVPVLAIAGADPNSDPSIGDLTIAATLRKPIEADQLLDRLLDAIAQSAAARAQSSAALNRIPSLLSKSTPRPSGPPPAVRTQPAKEKRRRCCPSCDEPLQWVESSKLRGVTYDYYRWCTNGCGLYTFNRSSGRFEVLDLGARRAQARP